MITPRTSVRRAARVTILVIGVATLAAACSETSTEGATTEDTTLLVVTRETSRPTTPVSTTPPTAPSGFVAEDPILNWLLHPDTRAARDHLALIGEYLQDIEAGRTDEEEAAICRSRLPDQDQVPTGSEAAALIALEQYPVPGSPVIDLHLATFALFGEYLEVCSRDEPSAAAHVLLDLENTVSTINEALTADRP